MRFYNRDNELSELNTLWQQADSEGRLAVITGRRRLGKTLLATEFGKNLPSIYLFVERKPELLLCADFLTSIREVISFPIVGEIKTFKEIMTLILEHAKKEKLLLIIDEFQDFSKINPSIYSMLQNLWDSYKQNSKLLMVVVGSIYSLMRRLFEDEKEPLFGRADRMLTLKPFSIATLSLLLNDYKITSIESLFGFYAITGGVPKYLDLLLSNGATTLEQCFDFIFKEFSPFLEEGKNQLIEEVGKEYGTYFAILQLIAEGKTTRPEIEGTLSANVGGYLDKLEHTYSLIYRVIPFGEKSTTQQIRFAIRDLFLNFWFRFIYRNWNAIELKNYNYVRKIIERDWTTYTGRILERFFIEILAAQQSFNRIGGYWERGNSNEIDIVAVNDLEKKMLIAEVKLNKNKINLNELQLKSQKLLLQYRDYKISWRALSLKDASLLLKS